MKKLFPLAAILSLAMSLQAEAQQICSGRFLTPTNLASVETSEAGSSAVTRTNISAPLPSAIFTLGNGDAFESFSVLTATGQTSVDLIADSGNFWVAEILIPGGDTTTFLISKARLVNLFPETCTPGGQPLQPSFVFGEGVAIEIK